MVLINIPMHEMRQHDVYGRQKIEKRHDVVGGRHMNSGIYYRILRDKWEAVDLVDMTKHELIRLCVNMTPREMINTIAILCEILREVDDD